MCVPVFHPHVYEIFTTVDYLSVLYLPCFTCLRIIAGARVSCTFERRNLLFCEWGKVLATFSIEANPYDTLKSGLSVLGSLDSQGSLYFSSSLSTDLMPV